MSRARVVVLAALSSVAVLAFAGCAIDESTLLPGAGQPSNEDGGGDDPTDGGSSSSHPDGSVVVPAVDGAAPPADGGVVVPSPDSSTPPPPGVDSGTPPPAVDSGAPPDESVWLDGMNAARAAVGETPLVWNPIAAQVAANYAALCNFEHNPNRNAQYEALGGGTGGLGENIAAGAPTQDPAAAVTAWVNEDTCYDHASNTCSTSGSCAGTECGHYTQIVWKDTTAVGCAHVSCTTNTPFGSQFPDWDFSVCDYSPPGNVVGESPY